MAALIRKLFSAQSLAKGAQGPVPSSKEAYGGFLNIAFPSVLEMVLMSFINMIDTMMVSTVGTAAVAAVGLVNQPRMLFICIFFALNVGVTAVVARRKGEGRQKEANIALRNAVLVCAALSVVMMVLALLVSTPLMRFAGAVPGETLEDADIYFRILMIALPMDALSMCICAAQRGVGNTKLTMYVNVAKNLVNVLFNYLLINGIGPFPELQVTGAAIATAIGVFVGFVLSVVSLMRGKHSSFLHISFKDDWRLDKEAMQGIKKVAGSAIVEQMALRFGFFAYAKIVADLGTDAFAAHQIACQFLGLSFNFADGLGVAGTALVGQMLGAKRPDLAHMYGKISQRLAFLTAVLLALTVTLLRAPLVGLYIHSTDGADVRRLAEMLMLIVGAFQIFQTSSVVMSGCLRGAGDTKFVARVMLITVAIMRPGLAFLFVYVLGTKLGLEEMALMFAWLASLLDMITRMTLCTVRFNGGKWHDIKV